MTERKRLVADRFRRISHVVEEIAANPGQSRREIAEHFFLSERQLQADLNIIRCDMRLPLIRRQGYRFADEGQASSAGAFTLQEAQLLVMILGAARRDHTLPKDHLDGLIAKLPALFPPHLQPLTRRMLEAIANPRSGRQQQVFAALGDALLRSAPVKLHYLEGDGRWYGAEPIVWPETILFYLGSWYLVAEVDRASSSVMFDLDGVTAVTQMAAEAGRAVR